MNSGYPQRRTGQRDVIDERLMLHTQAQTASMRSQADCGLQMSYRLFKGVRGYPSVSEICDLTSLTVRWRPDAFARVGVATQGREYDIGDSVACVQHSSHASVRALKLRAETI